MQSQTQIGGEILVNRQSTGTQQFPSVAALTNGRFVVTWGTDDTTQDGSGEAIKARLYNADGTPAGDEFLTDGAATQAKLAKFTAVRSFAVAALVAVMS